MKILNWRTGAVTWEGEATTMRDAVLAAIASQATALQLMDRLLAEKTRTGVA